MACCKSQGYFGWCKHEEIVYTDPKKKGYCVFHAPRGNKGITVEEFNKRVFAKINGVIEERKKGKEKTCNLRGTIFEGEIWFSIFNKNNPLPPIDFVGATFSGVTIFMETSFSGRADFSGVNFSDQAYFIGATFSGEAYFTAATFRMGAGFIGATFLGEANFAWATFSDVADFKLAIFSDALFRATKKKKKVVFMQTTLKGITLFAGKLAEKKQEELKEGAIKTKIIKNIINQGEFTRLAIEGKLIFEDLDISKVSFLDTDLREVDFVNVTWPKKFGREVLYDEIELGKKPKKDDISKVELLYRRLKQKYKDEHDWPQVSNWHYGEKEMFRKGSPWRRYNPLSLSNLFWLSSGYGERPVRAGVIFSLLIFLLFPSLLGFFGLLSLKDSAELKEYPELLINTFNYILPYRNSNVIPKNAWGDFAIILAKILIPLQAAYFALAVRNRFRR